jgi:hypothetical protein
MPEKFFRVRVTSSQDYFITLSEDASLDERIADWFKEFSPNRPHPARDGSIIANTKKFTNIKLLSQGELKDG